MKATLLLLAFGLVSLNAKAAMQCHWSPKPTVLKMVTSGTCKAKTNKLPTFICEGVAYCNDWNSNNVEPYYKTLICEASSDGTCPSVEQCESPGTKPGNPSRVIDLDSEAAMTAYNAKNPKIGGFSEGGTTTIQGITGIVSSDKSQGIVAVRFDKSRGWTNEESHNVIAVCTQDQYLDLESCKKDSCETLAVAHAEELNYIDPNHPDARDDKTLLGK